MNSVCWIQVGKALVVAGVGRGWPAVANRATGTEWNCQQDNELTSFPLPSLHCIFSKQPVTTVPHLSLFSSTSPDGVPSRSGWRPPAVSMPPLLLLPSPRAPFTTLASSPESLCFAHFHIRVLSAWMFLPPNSHDPHSDFSLILIQVLLWPQFFLSPTFSPLITI